MSPLTLGGAAPPTAPASRDSRVSMMSPDRGSLWGSVAEKDVFVHIFYECACESEHKYRFSDAVDGRRIWRERDNYIVPKNCLE